MPADLAYLVGALRAAGLTASARDLSMGFVHHAIGHHPAWSALRAPATYADREAQLSAHLALFTAFRAQAASWPADWGLRHLHLSGVDEGDAVAGRQAALDPRRNPALAYLRREVRSVMRDPPERVAIALVHPDQRPQCLALATLFRRQGYDGELILYGSFEDVIAPLDLAPDLIGDPVHDVFSEFDAVVLGEAGDALVALCRGEPAPNVVRAGDASVPEHRLEDLSRQPDPVFDWVRPEIYPYPEPVVDLRLGRGCPWGKCAFCAIQAHQPGYRFTPAASVARAMASAHTDLGSTHFRVRDDLLTPTQIRDLGRAVNGLDFQAHWMARARFEPALSGEVLQNATGLEELWLGLESAVPRVRDAMDKGVRQDVVERILAESGQVRLRALCLLGFPGETEDEARQTIDFAVANQDRLAGVSLTPFELMRRSPMASDPARYGLEVGSDPVPRERRMRHTLPVVSAPGMPAGRAEQLKHEALPALMDLIRRDPGPWPTHTWVGASRRT